jgi:hypothetical protein
MINKINLAKSKAEANRQRAKASKRQAVELPAIQ